MTRIARTVFPDLQQLLDEAGKDQQIQAAFPGTYNPNARDALGGKDPLGQYEQFYFNDGEGAWGRFRDIAIVGGDDGNSLDMYYRKGGKWYWQATIHGFSPWRKASLRSKLIRLASEKPKGSSERRALLNLVG